MYRLENTDGRFEGKYLPVDPA